MNHFEMFNFKVVPCGDDKRPTVAWSVPETWCDWREREEIYGKHNNWYVVPSRYVTYNIEGIDWKIYVIDVDNHDGDKFNEAKEFITKEWKLPLNTLIVKTPSGGLHLYYKCLAEFTPATVDLRRINGLPIEIKSNVGVVAPNGIDRLVVRDMPIANLMPVQGTPFGDSVSCMRRNKRPPIKYVEDPNFNIEGVTIYDAPEGSRHRMCLGTIQYLKERGCKKELAIEWGERFMEHNGRVLQRNEIENMWDWDSGASQSVTVKHRTFKRV